MSEISIADKYIGVLQRKPILIEQVYFEFILEARDIIKFFFMKMDLMLYAFV